MQALGTVEVVGLVAAIEAADVSAKTADVEVIGYELAKGGGYVTIKIVGSVAAVQAATQAATQAAAQLSTVVSSLVIPRPNEQISGLIRNTSTTGYRPPAPPAPKAAEKEPANITRRNK